jgi:predicted O-methyltransferase YrrM
MTPRPWHEPRRPSDIVPLPWLHEDSIARLESIIEPHFRVVEHGAGGSTLWFAERVESVLSVESDLDWYREVKARAPKNVTIVIDTVPPHGITPCDLLFIDGERDSRPAWAMAAPNIVKTGGFVVFDNCNRPEFAEAREFLRSVSVETVTIDRNLQFSKYFVTDFYRMP